MGNRRQLNTSTFNDGDFVFAKMRGFRAWPGRIVNRIGTEYNVYFYGTWDHAKVSENQIFDFATHSRRYGRVNNDRDSKAVRSFKAAMLEIQLAMSEPDMDISYFNTVGQLSEEGVNPEDADTESSVLDSDSDSDNGQLPSELHIVGDSDADYEPETETDAKENNSPNSN
ncbi:hepatoma-derived growth factor-related protein 3 [Drosophila guanche]|uniref:Blast:Hepatoma-derived growth factor-like protein 1 n=1 Tax=Drosophila guanche TaxID=7266 RepID=A0A3B0KNE4_DROGU|nr:hepatoma-derived growth factor-related protein 3 [Drosophila guanche]SPP88109.1 blast:Hepatoma-derived growth factor-like protein 1 [Drosophila guanche]